MVQAHPVAILALAATAMCWVLAVLLFRVGPPGSVARLLAILLAVEGVTLASSGYIDLMLSPALRAGDWYATWFDAQFVVHTLGDCTFLALYPPFLARALGTPLAERFGGRTAQLALAGVAGVLFVAVLNTPMRFGASLLYAGLTMTFVFALVASIQAWSGARAEDCPRARSFALAFGIRDLCWGYVYANVVWQVWSGTMAEVPDDSGDPIYLIYALGTLFAVPLIAYGILRAHLFDIDLRIRWTIKQSTLAGIILAFVYLLSEGASRILSEGFGAIAGLLAAAVVVFFLAPLQRFAERVADAAMPNTRPTAEYAAFRKLQVYEAALAEAYQLGGISERERALLNRLRDTLGVSRADAEMLEQELVQRSDASAQPRFAQTSE